MASNRRLAVVIGINQTLSWGMTFYLPAVIALPAAQSLGQSRAVLLGAFSCALLISGVCAPRIGKHIDRHGGRGILVASCAVSALGLAVLGTASGLVAWYVGWLAIGVGMSLGLYDVAFATVGCLLGRGAAPVITGITLLAGFASTIFWPIGAMLAEAIGWQNTLLCYAAVQAAWNLPMVLALVPAGLPRETGAAVPAEEGSTRGLARAFACLSGFFTIRTFLSSAVAVFVLPLLQSLGSSLEQAIFAAAMIGPGQVLGRIIEFSLAKRLSLLARARAAAVLVPAALLVLLIGGPVAAAVFGLLYGIGNGVLSINRGTLPMAIFGPAGYAGLLGRLAVPVLIAQAGAPTLIAPLVDAVSPQGVAIIAAASAGFAALLLLPLRPPRGEG
ncbi:MAG: MFS transporter [Alphaproteobacteria bacterium]|nr:MFS transporter [Alphaproteobacteria bacterium]